MVSSMPGNGTELDVPQVLDVWSHVAPQYGGVGPAAAGLAIAVQRNSGWRSRMVAVCEEDESELSDGIPASVEMVPASGVRPAADIRLRAALNSVIEAADVVHVHGLWLPHSLATRMAAAKFKKPLVSSVHGMLEMWELKNKRLKKSIYSLFIERPSLARSRCFRALSEQEAADFRRFGLRSPIAVVPNGIGPLDRIAPGAFFRRFPQLSGKAMVLYLSRVHYKKGILNLLDAWPSVLRNHPNAHLAVAGPDCQGTVKRAEEIIARYNLKHAVTLCGTLNGETKFAALSAARVFCLPSYSEGQSVAVLEALSIGLPVVITPACNVDGVAESGAGIVTSNEASKLASALSEALSARPADWHCMSESARSLARARFSWSVIGETMHSVYSWMLGGTRPACLVN
jgi:glycosyltransferase involved in cell wall biosynthesis